MNRIVLAIAFAAIASSLTGCTRHWTRPADWSQDTSDTKVIYNRDGSTTVIHNNTQRGSTTTDPTGSYPTNGGTIPYGNSGGMSSSTTPGGVRTDGGTRSGDSKLGATANSRTKDGMASTKAPTAKLGQPEPVVDEEIPQGTITGAWMRRPDGKMVPGYQYDEQNRLIYHPDRPSDDPLYEYQNFPEGHPKAKKKAQPEPVVPFRREMTTSRGKQ